MPDYLMTSIQRGETIAKLQDIEMRLELALGKVAAVKAKAEEIITECDSTTAFVQTSLTNAQGALSTVEGLPTT